MQGRSAGTEKEEVDQVIGRCCCWRSQVVVAVMMRDDCKCNSSSRDDDEGIGNRGHTNTESQDEMRESVLAIGCAVIEMM